MCVKENADVFSGRILAYGALMRAGLFPKARKEQRREIFEDILETSRKRAYLRLPAFTFVLFLCEKASVSFGFIYLHNKSLNFSLKEVILKRTYYR